MSASTDTPASKALDALDAFDLIAQPMRAKLATDGGQGLSDKEACLQLLAAAKKMVMALQGPLESAWAFALHPAAHGYTQAAWACGLLKPWPRPEMGLDELVDMTKADRRVVYRMMRAMGVYDIFDEVREDTWAHNELSTLLGTGRVGGHIRMMAKATFDGSAKIPEYLAHVSYRDACEKPSVPTYFQWANGTLLEYHDWLKAQPTQWETFQKQLAMAVHKPGAQQYDTSIAALYPFEEVNRACGARPEDVFVVDVVGGMGLAVRDLQARCPSLVGKLVVEDVAETLEHDLVKAQLDEAGILSVPYDCSRETQPIPGAHIYMFRHAFPDWPDAKAIQVLENTVKALVRGQSRILIMEALLRPRRPEAYPTLTEINVTRKGGRGTARKISDWEALLHIVGLEIRRVFDSEVYFNVLEVGLKGDLA